MGADWSDLLQQRCGLALREPQVPVFAELLQSRTTALGLSNCTAYFDVLQAADDAGWEWSEIVDRLVSHETSFFRHPPSFEAIAAVVLPELRRRTGGATCLAVCSAGCSTGEEAYSLAMVALADPGGNFTVWGVDLSRRALESARRGRYGPRAVAGVPAASRKHFTPAGPPDPFDVSAEVRRSVRFLPANIFGTGSLFLSYDLIVCQNVLIYFTAAAVRRALATLASRLTPGGFLVLGPGEAPMESPEGLEPAGLAGVRAFRRTGRTPREVCS